MRRSISAAVATLALMFSNAIVGAPAAVAAAESASAQPNFVSVCGSADAGHARCFALRRTDVRARPAAVSGKPLAAVSGYAPDDLQSAYNAPSDTGGAGMTVAVVDAYGYATAEADLGVYRSQFSLPDCTTGNGCFTKADQRGGSTYPAENAGWAGETALDLQMVSAICPNCHILLVEADSDLMSDLAAAVDEAVTLGADAVSNSYGVLESSGYTLNSHYNHPGVAITASTGDCGYDCAPLGLDYYQGVEFPASSSNVVAVGGTSLTRDSSARGWKEVVWGDTVGHFGGGSGCSIEFSKPSWQTDANCSHRMVGDVAGVADPNTGVAVYYSGAGGWGLYGGTSASSPIIAAMFALAGGVAGGTQAASYLYAHKSNLYDVTSGTNKVWSDTYTPCSVSYYCNGKTGYDGPTGLGTPNGVWALGPTVPDKPRTVAAVAGFERAIVTWTAPAHDGGSAIIRYDVTSNDGQTCSWTSGPLYCTVTGLTNNTPYTFTVTATNSVGTGPASDASTAVTPNAGATYTPVTPYRVLDSRSSKGGTLFSSQIKQTVLIATADTHVPADAVAVTGNLTVTGQSGKGYVTVAPSLTNHVQPPTSTLNFPVGDNRANGVTVQLAAGGKLDFMYWTSVTSDRTQILFDVTGFFKNDAGGSTYHPVTPYRVLDSRSPKGGTLFSSQIKQTVLIATADTHVPTDAVAVTGNLTVTGQSYKGYVTVAPSLTNHVQPPTSTLNFPVGDNRANGVTVQLAAGGNLDFMYWSSRTSDKTQILFDVTGYFKGSDGATYYPVTPYRVLDSRSSKGGTIFSSQIKQTVLLGTWISGVPTDAVAATGNLTVTGQSYKGYVSVAPSLTNHVQPPTSTLNFPVGDNRANGVTVQLAAGGNLDFMYWSSRTSDKTQILFDVTGYFFQPGP